MYGLIVLTLITWTWWEDTPEPDAFVLEIHTEDKEFLGRYPIPPEEREVELTLATDMCFKMLTTEGEEESETTDFVCSESGICHSNY